MYNGNQMFQQQFWTNGPAPGQFYNFTGGYNGLMNKAQSKEFTTPGLFGTQHSSSPITTGTSVVGIKFDGGVMIAADNLVSYGSLARYQDVQRVFKINEKTIMGAGGDYADFQSLKRSIDQKMVEDMCHEDEIDMKPKSLYNWLTRVFYNRRSRFNPLWLEMVVGGVDHEGVPFLGHVDLRGRAYEDDVVATGFGKHLALPLVREQLVEGQKLTQQQASEVLRKCMEVLYYRDCRSMPKYTVAVCNQRRQCCPGSFNVNENWQLATMVKGY
ncbi:proteasome subunit beta type-4 [Lucilia sericata]|uniref:proteasome subunit beta type-4 n=1 Tax=Lucilia sericata TaxID=13632 RepID=UPI0018A80155|nr:proteasome subunit beta type-4 [Lucilia sericata]